MSQFLYYAPGKHQFTGIDVANAGLRYAIDHEPSTRTCGTGPDGTGGILFARTDHRLAFKPGEAQRWKRITGSELWCGLWTDDPPKPQELQRESIVSGEWITDDNGDLWCAPKARRFEVVEDQLVWLHNLPTSLQLDDHGRWVHGDVKPRFRKLWDLAMRYEDRYLEAAENATGNESSVSFDFPEASEVVFRSLQVNYRIGPVEFHLLGIYDTQFCFAVLDALIDKRRREEFWKKKLESAAASAAETGTRSSTGPEASTPDVRTDTCQPSPTA